MLQIYGISKMYAYDLAHSVLKRPLQPAYLAYCKHDVGGEVVTPWHCQNRR
jgi:hypothetical protein